MHTGAFLTGFDCHFDHRKQYNTLACTCTSTIQYLGMYMYINNTIPWHVHQHLDWFDPCNYWKGLIKNILKKKKHFQIVFQNSFWKLFQVNLVGKNVYVAYALFWNLRKKQNNLTLAQITLVLLTDLYMLLQAQLTCTHPPRSHMYMYVWLKIYSFRFQCIAPKTNK